MKEEEPTAALGLDPDQERALEDAGEMIVGGRLVVAPAAEKPTKVPTDAREGE
jgi:hypothetical protein